MNIDPPRPIQILIPENHSFRLNSKELQPIFENENIKNRQLFIVSIAGPHRQGKSFLMSFFIRFLNAQYKNRNITDWLDVNANQTVNGFKWRGGQKPETSGIWMWSELFTFDLANGDGIAIILLDTQGIFDTDSSVKDCVTIFALSMLASSVQCYNLMHRIREDDLQHLDMFAEYGRMAIDRFLEKPYESLLFLVRDWQYAFESEGYGWAGNKMVDVILGAENDHQTPTMRALRTRITSNFNTIGGFLLPYPGAMVAQGNHFMGDSMRIDSEFLTYVKQLAHDLFAPEHIMIKKIHGMEVRARDFIPFMQAYINVFNGNAMPEPKSLITATAEASNLIQHNAYLNEYRDVMRNKINDVDSYWQEPELLTLHQFTKQKIIRKVKPKLRGDESSMDIERRLDIAIEDHFNLIQQQNEVKRAKFMAKVKLHNGKLIHEVKIAFENTISSDLEDNASTMNSDHFIRILNRAHAAALQHFDAQKMGTDDLTKDDRRTLSTDLFIPKSSIEMIPVTFKNCMDSYTNAMRYAINRVKKPYCSQNELDNMHRQAKQAIMQMFDSKLKYTDHEFVSYFRRKAAYDMESKFIAFVRANNEMRRDFEFEEPRQLKSSGLQANRNIGDMIADGISYFVGFIQQFYKIISKFVPLFNMII